MLNRVPVLGRLLSQPKPADEAPDKPANARLMQEQAVQQLAELLDMTPDPDLTLYYAGIDRTSLRALLSDDEIDGALEVRREAVMQTPWRLEGDDRVARFVEEELERHHDALLRGAWDAIPYGYSVVELVYRERNDGLVGLDSAILKPFEWFHPYRDGTLRLNTEITDNINGVEVDTYFKFLLTRVNPSHRNPYGEALLSRLYWPWYFRRSTWRFWMQFLERFGTPLLIGKGRDPDSIAQSLARAVQDAVVAVGDGVEVDSVTVSGDGAAFERAEQRLSARIHRRILGQTLTSGTEGGSGNRALGEVHERVAERKRAADIRIVTGTMQQAVNALTALNFPGAEAPRYVLEDETGLSQERAERDATLASQVGVQFGEDYIARAYDLEPGEFEVKPPGRGGGAPPAAPPGAQQAHQGQPLEHTGHQLADNGERFTPGEQAVEDMARQLRRSAPQPINPDDIRTAVEAAENPAELQEMLAELAGDNPDAEAFQGVLERALFAAEIIGWETTENQTEAGDE